MGKCVVHFNFWKKVFLGHPINYEKIEIDLIKKGLKIDIKSVLTDLNARNLFLDYKMPYGELKTF